MSIFILVKRKPIDVSFSKVMNSITNSKDPMEAMRNLETDKKTLLHLENQEDADIKIRETKERISIQML